MLLMIACTIARLLTPEVTHATDDSMHHCKVTDARGYILISKFKICNDDVKLCLFCSYLSSIYGCQLWACYIQNVLKKAMMPY